MSRSSSTSEQAQIGQRHIDIPLLCKEGLGEVDRLVIASEAKQSPCCPVLGTPFAFLLRSHDFVSDSVWFAAKCMQTRRLSASFFRLPPLPHNLAGFFPSRETGKKLPYAAGVCIPFLLFLSPFALLPNFHAPRTKIVQS